MDKLTTLAPIVSLVAFCIAVVSAIFLIIQNSKLKRMIYKLNERIEKRKAELNELNSRYKQDFDALRVQLKSETLQNASSVSTSVAKKEEAYYEPFAEEAKPQQVEEKPKDVEHILYASSYDSERKQFFVIENSPSQKTIYEIYYLENKPEEGYFTIFNEAENKIVECRDHLDGASEIEGRGQRIDWENINPGRVSRKDNNWEVISPLNVKFV